MAGGQMARLIVGDLRSEQRHFERDDRLALLGRESVRSLSVSGRRRIRLIDEVEVQRREASRRMGDAVLRRCILERFAAIPHDGAQESEVGRWQWPPEQRQLRRACITVRILDGNELELGVGRYADADTDQTL